MCIRDRHRPVRTGALPGTGPRWAVCPLSRTFAEKIRRRRLPSALDRRIGECPAARRTARRDPRPAAAAGDVRRRIRHADREINPATPDKTTVCRHRAAQRPCKKSPAPDQPRPAPQKNPGRQQKASGICARSDAKSTRHRAGNISYTVRAGRNRPPRSRSPCVRGTHRATRSPGGKPTRR